MSILTEKCIVHSRELLLLVLHNIEHILQMK